MRRAKQNLHHAGGVRPPNPADAENAGSSGTPATLRPGDRVLRGASGDGSHAEHPAPRRPAVRIGGAPARRKLASGVRFALVTLAAFIGGVVVTSMALAVPERASPYRNLGTLARALAHIEMSYVEEPDQDALIYGAVRGMVSTLDPHSTFMDPEEYRILTSDTQGRFGGIGVEIQVDDGWIIVASVFDGGPAQRAGLREGDRFLSIDGRSARDLPVEQAVRRMRGEPGSQVRVRLRRESETQALDLTLTREIIRVQAVEARVLPDRVVYLQIRTFQETTTGELRRALDLAASRTASQGGVRGIILDLRNNPGGLLDESVLASDEFIREGVIVSTRGRDGTLLAESRASVRGTRPDWPMVVLVNGYTASAAEILAGALRDHGRAVIVGTRTFGKGSVQNIIELPDGSALKLTVARYYTPSGTSIQAEGIQPDMVVEQYDAATLEGAAANPQIREESLEGHLRGDRDEAGGGARPPIARGEPRIGAEDAGEGEPFLDDFQARMGYQALRALIAAHEGDAASSR